MPEWITRYWVEWLFGGLAGVMLFWWRYAVRRFMRERARQTALEAGIRALLRERMIALFRECESRATVSLEEMEIFEGMYQAYHSLGGNGTVTRLRERLRELPVSG